jgi:ATP-dependent Clp protease ATP-binding subunit ClpC
LTDDKGRLVDFTHTLIIATSNLGADVIQNKIRNNQKLETITGELENILRKQFRPEFLNRVDEIIVFDPLDQEQIKQILKLQLEQVAANARAQGIELNFDQSLIDHLTSRGYRPEYGARELKRLVQSEVETSLAKEMLSGKLSTGESVSLRFDDKENKTVIEPVKIVNVKEGRKRENEMIKTG